MLEPGSQLGDGHSPWTTGRPWPLISLKNFIRLVERPLASIFVVVVRASQLSIEVEIEL